MDQTKGDVKLYAFIWAKIITNVHAQVWEERYLVQTTDSVLVRKMDGIHTNRRTHTRNNSRVNLLYYTYTNVSQVKCHVSEPEEVLIYINGDRGEVAFVDAVKMFDDPEGYLVGSSTRPVGVAYDPLEKVITTQNIVI